MSTFPPDRITPTFLFLNSELFLNIAATATALEGSMIIFILSQINFMASTISDSSTRIILLTNFWMMGKFSSPSCVFSPSAMVFGLILGCIFPVFKER